MFVPAPLSPTLPDSFGFPVSCLSPVEIVLLCSSIKSCFISRVCPVLRLGSACTVRNTVLSFNFCYTAVCSTTFHPQLIVYFGSMPFLEFSVSVEENVKLVGGTQVQNLYRPDFFWVHHGK